MTTVHFIHSGTAYMPELTAYETHLERLGHSSQRHTTPSTVPDEAAIVWWICGRVSIQHTQRLSHSLHVHEYASASVAPLAWLKDRVKQWSHPAPDYRVFQSEWVRQRTGLTDKNTPYCLRDMGVPPDFLSHQTRQLPEFDLVYLGAMSRLESFLPTLTAINQSGLSLLLIGEVPSQLKNQLQLLPNIHAIGRIPQEAVPEQLNRARCGLNLMPTVLPLSEQTSTKMLEYLALGLPVISNAYGWAKHCMSQHPGRIQLIDQCDLPAAWKHALANSPERIAYRQHLHAYAWPEILSSMPIWQQLKLVP